MLLDNPAALQAAVPPGARLIGLDVGTKTIGLALATRGSSSPARSTRSAAGGFATTWRRCSRAIDRHGVGGIVIGLPLALDGRDSPRTQSVRAFARNLLALRDLPALFWDERLSTAAVTREMIAADMTRKRRAEIVDKVAAAYILQGCLDAMASLAA